MLLSAVNLDVTFLLVKGKFVPSHAMKAQGGVEVQFHAFLTLELAASDQLHAPATLPHM
jgi:hypothetical protein